MIDMHLTLNDVALKMLIAAALHLLLISAARRGDRPKKKRPKAKEKTVAKNRTSGPKSYNARMFASPAPRRPAPLLARGAVRLRRHVGPNAFGNALGNSLAENSWGSSGASQGGGAQAAVGSDGAIRVNGKTFMEAVDASRDNPFYVPPAADAVLAKAGTRNGGMSMRTFVANDGSSFSEDVAQRMAEFTPGVIVKAQYPTEDMKLAVDIVQRMAMNQPAEQPGWIEQNRASDQQHYRDMEANATNPVSAVMARYGSIANHAFYDLAAGAQGLYRLATDAQTQINAVKGAGYALTHPGEVANAAGDQFMKFANMQPGERAESIMRFGLGGLATAGAGEGLGLAGRGLAATAEWVAPKAGQMFEAYMARTGGLAYMADASGAGGNTVWLDSSAIRQSQKSISYAKSGGYTLDDIARGFVENPADPRLSIDAVRMPDGMLTSVDNSRPAVRNATGGGEIQVRVRAYDEPLTASEVRRFTVDMDGVRQVPTTWGEAVETRIWKQGDQFMTLYPNGSPFVPKVTGAPAGSIWSQYNQYPWMR